LNTKIDAEAVRAKAEEAKLDSRLSIAETAIANLKDTASEAEIAALFENN
jgi:hypothetical protein